MSRLTHALAFGAGALLASVGAVSLLLPAAHAGFGVDNDYICLHFNPGDLEPVYEVRHHRGDSGIEETSVEFGTSEMIILRGAAAQDQVAFDAMATTELGAWYTRTDMTTTRKAEWRQAFQLMCH